MDKNQNIYELKLELAIAFGISMPETVIAVTELYLEGKPAKRGENKVKAAERNSDNCYFVP